MKWKTAIETVVFLVAVAALVYLVPPGAQKERESVVTGFLTWIGVDPALVANAEGDAAAGGSGPAPHALATIAPASGPAASAPRPPEPAVAKPTATLAPEPAAVTPPAPITPSLSVAPADSAGRKPQSPGPLPAPLPVAGEPSKAEVGGVSCLVLGAASVGVVLVAGPLQLAATVAGATLGAPSPALVAGLIGAAFAAGCAVGALTVPALIWAENAGGQMSVQVADGLAVVNRRLGRPFDSGTTAPAVSGGRS